MVSNIPLIECLILTVCQTIWGYFMRTTASFTAEIDHQAPDDRLRP